MQITYSKAKQTYVAQDKHGHVLGIYDPKVHGTVEDFRNAMIAMVG